MLHDIALYKFNIHITSRESWTRTMYTVSQKTFQLCPYLPQMLTDCQNSFTGTLPGNLQQNDG